MTAAPEDAPSRSSLQAPPPIADAIIAVVGLDMIYDGYVVQRDVSLQVRRGSVFVIMGGSGCGKSSLLRHIIGLTPPAAGRVLHDGQDYWALAPAERDALRRKFGVLFQSGALFSSMTLQENIALPLQLNSNASAAEIAELAQLKLALVGLRGFEHHFPAQISGGMKKRAGLARALALDPALLFLDEPSAGLDPISSRRLDELILSLRDDLGTTIVMVTHELPSIFSVADDSVYLDAVSKTAIAWGDPKRLRDEGPELVRAFLNRDG